MAGGLLVKAVHFHSLHIPEEKKSDNVIIMNHVTM